MKNLLLLMLVISGLATPPAAKAASLISEYWPMNSGDIRYYTGPAGRIYVEVEEGFDAPYDFNLYEYDEEEDDYFSSTTGQFGVSGDRVLEYGAEVGWNNFSWAPPLPVLTESALANGGTRTFNSVLEAPGPDYPVTVTITIAYAGTVTVPAGTFHTCRTVRVTARVAGQSRVVSAEAWTLAPKVGQIRIGVANGAGQLAGWESLTGGTVDGVNVRDLANQVPPVLTITSPRANERQGNAMATVRGTARDNVSVSNVLFQLNESAWQLAQTANGWTNWAAGVSLSPGTNSLRAYAVDGRGHNSGISSVRFIYDPVLPLVGEYNGLFHGANTVGHGSSGSIKAKIRAGGAFSATLRTGARPLAIAGRLGLNGKSTNTVARPGASPLTLELSLQFGGSDELIGRVTDGIWSSTLVADRAVFSASANPATNFARQYTMLIPGGTNGSVTEPAGNGCAAVTISRAGLATIKTTLADGTPAVATVPVSKGGDIPLYLTLYGGAGSALGWLRVQPSSELDLDGAVAWFKPARPMPAIYTNGFALSSLVAGSAYTPFGTNRLFNADTGSVVFTEGGLMDAFPNLVFFGPNGRVTKSGLNRLTFKAVSASGLFSGTIVPPAGSKPIPFKGTLLQRQGYGGGFFLSSGQSGEVRLELDLETP